MTKEKFASLDGIKGIAIWFIVLYHTLGHFGSTYPSFLTPIKKYGGTFGNSLFFMISGFTICYVYKETILDYLISFKQFIGKRIKKIYPCYLISSLVCLCMFTVIHERSTFTLTELILNLLMITSGWINDLWPFNYPCWFVSQLLLCYIIYYNIVHFFKRECVICGYIILVGIGYFLCTFPMEIPFCYKHDGIGFLNFFMGCLLYEFYISNSHKFKKIISVLGICFVLVILCFILKYGFEVFIDSPDFLFAFIVSPVCIISAIELNSLRYILGNELMMITFGKISMAVFFWHVPVTAVFITIRNHSEDFMCPANMYYIILIITIFVFCHLMVILRNRVAPRFNNFLRLVLVRIR